MTTALGWFQRWTLEQGSHIQILRAPPNRAKPVQSSLKFYFVLDFILPPNEVYLPICDPCFRVLDAWLGIGSGSSNPVTKFKGRLTAFFSNKREKKSFVITYFEA